VGGGLLGLQENAVEEAALLQAVGLWGKVVEVFDESTAKATVMEMEDDLGRELVRESAFLLGEEEGERGTFFVMLGTLGEDLANVFGHRHRLTAPKAGKSAELEHFAGDILGRLSA
jgi:hypothetical protein